MGIWVDALVQAVIGVEQTEGFYIQHENPGTTSAHRVSRDPAEAIVATGVNVDPFEWVCIAPPRTRGTDDAAARKRESFSIQNPPQIQ
jgi:hypothetical protein